MINEKQKSTNQNFRDNYDATFGAARHQAELKKRLVVESKSQQKRLEVQCCNGKD